MLIQNINVALVYQIKTKIKSLKINKMKISIELTSEEVKGIKQYHLSEFGEKISKEELKLYIQGIVSTTLSSPRESVSDYIKNYEK